MHSELGRTIGSPYEYLYHAGIESAIGSAGMENYHGFIAWRTSNILYRMMWCHFHIIIEKSTLHYNYNDNINHDISRRPMVNIRLLDRLINKINICHFLKYFESRFLV